MVRLDLSTAPANSSRSDPNKRKGGRQTGMMSFYKGTTRCLGCKHHMPSSKSSKASEALEPGLCDICRGEDGKWEETYLEYLGHVNKLEARKAGAHAYCMRCDSGAGEGAVVCENGECPVLYARVESQARLETVTQALKRLDW